MQGPRDVAGGAPEMLPDGVHPLATPEQLSAVPHPVRHEQRSDTLGVVAVVAIAGVADLEGADGLHVFEISQAGGDVVHARQSCRSFFPPPGRPPEGPDLLD